MSKSLQDAKRAQERLMKHIQSKEFSSIEEVEAYMSSLVGRKIDDAIAEASISESEVEQILQKAGNANNKNEYDQYVEKAYAIEPENVDVLIHKSKGANTSEEAISWLEKAVAAGRKELGDEFEELRGNFWLAIETRPYMRARMNLAELLISAERYDEAIEHLEDLLDLNPDDNLAARYELAGLLLAQRELETYAELYDEYSNDTAAPWLLARAIYCFLKRGKSPYATAAWKAVNKANPFIAKIVTGELEIEEAQYSSYAYGSEEEALIALNSLAPVLMDHRILKWMHDQALR